ncbi:uncharacterized protein LOC129728500 [Wyeomyia smithii]|uniref:uncharacterized protein LOC129728500 n=1 Tax=Wyeomyia smithii TaxID=174621 RepID=UPI002467AE87|nr:uncharacterized protein LOC129728500 [Wyeomyia smithii]
MVELNGTQSSITLSVANDTTSENYGNDAIEGYNLIVLLKSFTLNDFGEDDPRELNIRLLLGDSDPIEIFGTVSDINKQRRGFAISIPCDNPEQFKDYLSNNNLKVIIDQNGSELGGTSVCLAENHLVSFDPPHFEPTIISQKFAVKHGSLSVGTIHLILKTDKQQSAVELNASKIENDSILYIVNDTPERRSSEYQEDTMRQLLTCKKCSGVRSPSEVSCRYELIDGILTHVEKPKRDMDLELMKRKLERIERKAKLYPVGAQQDLPKDNVDNRICKHCGGITVTGKTCGRFPWRDDTEVGYPEGSAKRFSPPIDVPVNYARISEPTFVHSNKDGIRSTQSRSNSYPLHTFQQPDRNYLCPTSVGIRHCERCGLNMDWLPPHATCPKCNYKSQPFGTGNLEPAMHEITPSRMNSWMGDFEFAEPQKRQSLAASGRSLSLEVRPCPLCRLRGGRCPDCERRASITQQDKINSTTQSSTSDSEMLARKSEERPKTRQSLRDRFMELPKRLSKAARLSQLQKVYGDDAPRKQEKLGPCSTRSSTVSLNVEDILKKSQTKTKKIMSDGIQSIEVRKVGPGVTDNLDKGCSALSSTQIRKNQRSLLRQIKKQNRGTYSYRYGNRYPGIVVGHQECIHRGNPVPPHMGWRWDIKTPGIGCVRKGWRPGAVRKTIKELMQHFLVSYPLDNVPVSRKGKRSSKIDDDGTDKIKQKHTLQIVKRNGEYAIVMNPLKDSQTLKTAQDPYLACEPIRFKLTKDPNMSKLYQLRNALKVKGFTMCGCSEFDSCNHRSEKEKKIMSKEMRKLSKRLGLAVTTELKDIPAESESELDLEFTPPSAMLKSGVRKADVVCTETQYCEEDYKVQVPADKLKCYPGQVDPLDVTRVKFGRGMNVTAGRDGKAFKGGMGGKGQRGSAGGKSTGTGKGAGAGVGTGSGKNVGAGKETGSRKGVGDGKGNNLSKEIGAGKGAGVGKDTIRGKDIVSGTGKGGVGKAGTGAGGKNGATVTGSARARNKSHVTRRGSTIAGVGVKSHQAGSNRLAATITGYGSSVPAKCGYQVSSYACYTSPCAPVAVCYNSCCTGCTILLIARKSYYPADEFAHISETENKIKLQHLLDLTAERIIEVNEGKLINLTDAEFLLDLPFIRESGV